MKIICSEDIGLIEEQIYSTKKKIKKMFLEENFENLYLEIGQESLFEDQSNTTYYIFDSNKKFSSKIEKKVDDLLSYLNNTNEDIIFGSPIKEPSKTYWKYFKNENIKLIKKLNKWTMKDYVKKYLKKNNVNINDELLFFIYENIEPNSLFIKNELNKIISYYENNKRISKDIIEKLLVGDLNKTVFDLIDYFFRGDYKNICKQLKIFEESKIDFIEIFNVMVSQVFMLKLYILNYEKNKDINTILKDFSLQQFQIEKQLKLIYNTPSNCIDKFLKNLLKLDIDFMSGKKDLNISLKILLMNGGEYGI